jgi:exopolyphosphatase/guanosine-5'-triphosphate,3'-diphosphate pyrophosphatase
MVAAIARYHRRSLPKKRHEAWQLIEGREQRRLVSEMALLLRLAAALDLRPVSAIEAITAHAAPGRLELHLQPAAPAPGEPEPDLSLERWSLRSCEALVMEASGVALTVQGE